MEFLSDLFAIELPVAVLGQEVTEVLKTSVGKEREGEGEGEKERREGERERNDVSRDKRAGKGREGKRERGEREGER